MTTTHTPATTHVVLVPGFWLGAWAWDDVVPVLREAGLTPHAVTLPGLESPGDDRSAVTLDDHVTAMRDLIDGLTGDVVLVGHSGGGAVVQMVTDQRPERVRRVVYVDSGPVLDGVAVARVGALLVVVHPEHQGEDPAGDHDVADDVQVHDVPGVRRDREREDGADDDQEDATPDTHGHDSLSAGRRAPGLSTIMALVRQVRAPRPGRHSSARTSRPCASRASIALYSVSSASPSRSAARSPRLAVRSSSRVQAIARAIARASIGSSLIPQAIPPPACWSASAGGGIAWGISELPMLALAIA